MTGSAVDGLYYEFHIPLGLKELITQLAVTQPTRNTPTMLGGSAVTREWFSQPRPCTDLTIEVVTAHFKLPLSVSEIGFEALRVPCQIEVWYQDRLNNWRQVLDMHRVPVAVVLQATNSASWYKFHTLVYPIVAKAVRFHIQRTVDNQLGSSPYVVGMKNTLIRRNVYDRTHGTVPFEEEQDPLGNVIAKYIKDWDAPKAIDDDPHTYWRSAPMPDPNAVVSMYLDTRAPDGTSQLIDKVYLDPVYTGQSLNLYYSNDDSVSGRKLSPITLAPDTDTNTDWRSGRGRWDTSVDPGNSEYSFTVAWGPLVEEPCWIGMEWIPDFEPDDGPPGNPVLFRTTPVAEITGIYHPEIYYDVGAGEITLELTDGTSTQTYNVALSPILRRDQPLRIVVGWKYNPDTVVVLVKDQQGNTLADLTETPGNFPDKITLDGTVGFEDFRGTFTAHVVKLESYTLSSARFQLNPTFYCSPDPVVTSADGTIPSTSLDNAIYAVDWTLQQHGTGGSHESIYTGKTWTPVWRDYYTQKGKLILPQAISMKYLKLEFSSLTEEPYPVYDSGIQTTYRVYPTAVQQQQAIRHLGIAGSWNAIGEFYSDPSVNWLQPSTVARALNAAFGPILGPLSINQSAGITVNSVATSAAEAIAAAGVTEVSNPLIYRRQSMTAEILANQAVYDQTGSARQRIETSADLIREVMWANTLDTWEPLREVNSRFPGLQPVQGDDWWVFPGGQLKMNAWVMENIAAQGQVLHGRPSTIETRMRFVTASVHRYDLKTVTRSTALAYFAGVREVRALVTSYIDAEDPLEFSFTSYDASQWVKTNTVTLDTGPTTTNGQIFSIPNPDFDLGMGLWFIDSGNWQWDGDDTHGHWYPGAAYTTANGTTQRLRSPKVVPPGDLLRVGDNITFSIWVRWRNLVIADNLDAIRLGLVSYNGDVIVNNDIELETVVFADWVANEDTDDFLYVKISGDWQVPSGVDGVRAFVEVTEDATAGEVWADLVEAKSADDIEATVFKEFTTTSSFAKVRTHFSDSGLVRSNEMWARADPLATNIEYTALAYYTSTIPDVIPGGMWADSFVTWDDPETPWGAPRALVAIDVAPDRIFQGRRVLHFVREPGAGEAGIKIRQWTNFIPNGLFRICARWYKPRTNNNLITFRLRRVSDGVDVYEKTITQPAAGYWHEYTTQFIEIPDSPDQVYTVEMVLTGDDDDELYLSDLWVEIAHVRYFMRLGGIGAFLHDVTELAYSTNDAIVSSTLPVNEFSIQAVIMSPKSFVYGCRAQPLYLK